MNCRISLALAFFVVLLTVQAASAFYAPHIGRFVNRDPAGQPHVNRLHTQAQIAAITYGQFIERDEIRAPYHDGMNTYQYVGSRPLISLDPSGLAFYVVGDDIPSTGANGQYDIQRCCVSACGCQHTTIWNDDSPLYDGFGGGYPQIDYPEGQGPPGLPTGPNKKIVKLERCDKTYIPNNSMYGGFGGGFYSSGVTIINKLDHGPNKGKDCSQATNAEIAACLRARPAPSGKPGPLRNCQTDAESAARDCCLCGFKGLSLSPNPAHGVPRK